MSVKFDFNKMETEGDPEAWVVFNCSMCATPECQYEDDSGSVLSISLFRNKGFLVNLKTERNASKFAMFMEKENPHSFFRFSFRATFIFPL